MQTYFLPLVGVGLLGWIAIARHSVDNEITNILHTPPLRWCTADWAFVGTLLLTFFVSLGLTLYLLARRKQSSETTTRPDDLRNLLAIVPDQTGNYWEKVERDGIVYLLLRGHLRVTNLSRRVGVLIPKSGVVGYDSVGTHMVPDADGHFWGHDYLIGKRTSVSLQFDYQIKDFRHKTSPKMKFDLFFVDHLANKYSVNLEFREFKHPNPLAHAT